MQKKKKKRAPDKEHELLDSYILMRKTENKITYYIRPQNL